MKKMKRNCLRCGVTLKINYYYCKGCHEVVTKQGYLKSLAILLGASLLILLSACNNNNSNPYSSGECITPKDVHLMLLDFKNEASRYGVILNLDNTSVTIGELPDNVAGRCQSGKVTIDVRFWDVASGASKEALLYHELGHCVLRQSHRDNSIMQAKLIQDYCEKRTFYLEELFLF